MSNLTIAPPTSEKTPLKVNVFERARQANTQLAPLFPYLTPGSIVPALSLAIGGPGRSYQMFKHFNSVDEVATIFAAAGVARGHPGQVFVGARDHFVNLGFNDPTDPESFILIVVTQRQWEKSDQRQHEKLAVICEQCHEPLIERPFNSDCSAEELAAIRELDGDIPFHTHVEGAKMVADYNANKALHTCAECGFENKPFPIDDWGWHRYSEQTAMIDSALRCFKKTETTV
ncbi:hypothetical protein [Herbaspirillum lusitanum]|uniref:hypothetical protein n=1 Tax=Herbaspirillum lusitanum TaxID=213312 RepID=UPI0012F4C078|nr:hypothetical protein [Herbaspirillum lusitanum]